MKRKSDTNLQSPFNKALKYLSYRQRSIKEIRDYLQKKDFSEQEISETIQKLLDYKFLNDTEFARTFVNSKQLRGKSKRNISFELKLKGVSPDTSEEVLNEAKDDLEIAKEYIQKRIHQLEKLPKNDREKKIINRLKMRGYNWDIISEVLKIIETTS